MRGQDSIVVKGTQLTTRHMSTCLYAYPLAYMPPQCEAYLHSSFKKTLHWKDQTRLFVSHAVKEQRVSALQIGCI